MQIIDHHAIVHWSGSPEASGVRAMADDLRAAYADSGQPLVCWMILDAAEVSPPRNHRAERNSSPSDGPSLSEVCASVEAILLGSGLKARLLRTTLRGLTAINRSNLRIRIHDTVYSGLAALDPPDSVRRALIALAPE